MDLIQLLVTVAAVLGMIVVGLLAVIPTALELRDLDVGSAARPGLLKTVTEVSLGRATAGAGTSTAELAGQLAQPRQQSVDVLGGVVERQPDADRAAAA
jgi:hypothetical protein